MAVANSSAREMLEHAWRYFALHANQRMSIFNFFLILSGVVSAGLAACIQRNDKVQLLGIALGVLLALVSLAFWKLDQRTSLLIKHAENAIAELEQNFPTPCSRLFSAEPEYTSKNKLSASWYGRSWTYGRAFRFVFAVMGLVGLAGAVVCAWLYINGSSYTLPPICL